MDRSLYSGVVCALLVGGAVAGCAKSSAPKSDSPALASAQALSAVASEPVRRTTAPPAQNPRDFGAMFRTEAESRPAGTIKAEDALQAFRRDGVELDSVRQHLGRPYGARYCVGAKSGTTIALSVCEYVDPAAANAGAELSRKLVLANREIRINQATSLTVREVEKTPGADALVDKLFASFAKLSALATTK